ncbi:class I SAM-dependent methyltransferase [Virgibacillus flavescens]|uniref:class I SAM-dependent methyltransferase n=1 Tax=Virgibacillus flavescens TaxID=1611422 RepID=UPI003D326BD0
MGKWFPAIYDAAMKPLERNRFRIIRDELISKTHGSVLEVGSGSGVNFSHYKYVSRVDAIEPNPEMVKRSEKYSSKSNVPIQIHQAKAESLPFQDNTFDSVVATLVFCTIPDPVLALKEIKRVSKPGATVLFFEHVKMEQKFLGKVQEVFTPLWSKLCDGCHLNRDTLERIQHSGMKITRVDSYYRGLFLKIEATINKA